MPGSLIVLIAWLLIIGLLLYAAHIALNLWPVNERLRQLVMVVIILLVVLFMIQRFGLL